MTECNDVVKVCEIEVDPLLECKPTGDAEGNTHKNIIKLSLIFHPIGNERNSFLLWISCLLVLLNVSETLPDIYIILLK